MAGKNIGNLLNDKGITWGWFQGGFKPSNTLNNINSSSSSSTTQNNSSKSPVCNTSHKNIIGNNVTDYVVHHEPFQYYQPTANPYHLPPTSTTMIGKTDQANHQYDLSDFWNAV